MIFSKGRKTTSDAAATLKNASTIETVRCNMIHYNKYDNTFEVVDHLRRSKQMICN